MCKITVHLNREEFGKVYSAILHADFRLLESEYPEICEAVAEARQVLETALHNADYEFIIDKE